MEKNQRSVDKTAETQVKGTFFYKLIHGIIKNNIKSRRISHEQHNFTQ